MAAVTLLAESRSLTLNEGTAKNASSLAFGLYYFLSPDPSNTLFAGQTIVQGDSGKFFVSNSSTDPQFDGFAIRLTNGFSEILASGASLGTTYTPPSSGDHPEASFFALPPGSNGIDFQGFTIDHIAFQVTSVSISSPSTSPNGDGVWTDYRLSGVFQVYGEQTVVPEPSAVGLLGLGAMGLVLRRRRPSAVLAIG